MKMRIALLALLLSGAVANANTVQEMRNLSLSCSVASNNLTCSMLGSNGSAPSQTNPVLIPFRSATATAGTTIWRAVVAANSFTVSSGATLGTTNGAAFTFHIVACDDAGTVRMGMVNYPASRSVYPLNQTTLISTSGAAANSASTIYTGTAVTTKACVPIGYLTYTSGLATAGTYNVAPDITNTGANLHWTVAGTANHIQVTESGATQTFDFSSVTIVTSATPFSFNTNAFTLRDASDTTKTGTFDLSGITTATNRALKWPNAAGTVAISGSSPITVNATTGDIACATCAPNPGTSGGIPYYNSTTSMASSALLAANGVVYGGGAATTPASTAAGTTGQVLIGGTPPSFSASPSLTTSLTAPALIGSTSVTSPLVIGGSGTTGTQLTFKTTTGNGTTDAFAFVGGNNGATAFGDVTSVRWNIPQTTAATTNTTGALTVAGSIASNTSMWTKLFKAKQGADTQFSGGFSIENVAGSSAGAWFQGSDDNTYFMASVSHNFNISDSAGAGFISANATTLTVSPTTDATSTTTGALRVPGGMSVNKRVWADGLTAASGTPTSICRNANEITVNAALTCTVSAREFKQDIRPLPDMSSSLLAMQPRLFQWKAEPGKDHIGFIADEVASAQPMFAAFLKDKPHTWHVEVVTTALVQGYQGHETRIRALEKRFEGRRMK